MSDDNKKAWKKAEDIPRRFDELPPEPDWVPVAEVIRTQREDEAKKEAQKIKVMPPVDSDSDNENYTQHNMKPPLYNKNIAKKNKTPVHNNDENVKKHETPRKSDVSATPSTVDDVTQSMLAWALSPDYYPRKVHKKPSPYKADSKSLEEHQRPSHLAVDKGHSVKERQVTKQSSQASMSDNRKPVAPHGGSHSRPKILSPQKMQVHTGDAHIRDPLSTKGHPLYDEPSPDYDEEDYDAYYSKYQQHDYYDQNLENDEYYIQEQGYEEDVVADPYFYDAGSFQDEYSPYNPDHVYYNNPQRDYGLEHGMPQYTYDHHGALHHYNQRHDAIPKDKPRSRYDVLY